MKRFVFLIIASIATGKLVGSYLNNFADTHTPKIHKRLANDHAADDGLSMAAIPDQLNENNRRVPTLNLGMPQANVFNGTPLKPAVLAVAAKPSPSPEDPKQKKKKEDEEAAKKVANAAKPAGPPPYFQPPGQFYVPQQNFNPGGVAYGGAIAMPVAPSAAPAVAAGPATANKGAANNNPATSTTANNTNLNSWITELTTQPNAVEMQQFVALYSSGKVTQAQFYSVMTAMEKSAVVESRTLLVQTLNGMKNAESFQILSDVSATDSDTTTRNQALQAADAYNNVSYLSILSTALSSSDTNEAINGAADLQMIAQSAQQNMTAATQSLFRPFVQLLQPLTQSSNANLRQYAAQALASVEAIVGTSVAGN